MERFAAERRELARLERRAVAAYERDLARDLRELAVVEAACRAIAVRRDRWPSVELQLTGRSLVLLGVSEAACLDVDLVAADGVPRIVAAGRYNKRWWVTIDNGLRAAVVLAERAYLSPDQGGIGVDVRVA